MDYYELLQPQVADQNSRSNLLFVNEVQEMINRLNECDEETFQEVLKVKGTSLELMVSLLAYGFGIFNL